MRLCALVVLLACPTVYCQKIRQPLTQVEACKSFRSSIVQVDTDTMHGTGFIVGPDGWIITALHVVADQQTLIKRENILVSIVGHPHSIPAEIVSPLDNIARLRDFAILKIHETNLPALDLGSEVNIDDGSPIAIIGFPLSASLRFGPIPRFCLMGTVAAQTTFPLPQGNLQFLRTIYFQGISVKGISGAPIISLVTGKVIGIVSTKLAGITPALDEVRKNTSAGGDIQVIGTNGNQFGIAGSITPIIDVLDNQLANGLGSGTGASDAAYSLKKAKRDYGRQHATQGKQHSH
jgi:hypothetical protein